MIRLTAILAALALTSCESIQCLHCTGHTTIDLCEDEVAYPDIQLPAVKEQLEASGYTCTYRAK